MNIVCLISLLPIIFRAGFGYGDFLAWSGLPISPYEPMLYEPNMNYPDLNGYDFTEMLDEVSVLRRVLNNDLFNFLMLRVIPILRDRKLRSLLTLRTFVQDTI